ncbi:MAG: CusA/CzcA family heavy metal efflux RND transporter, partial [bacterium]|nr:CusA/CzcA family heavy metal efflux RND transporter [bacterium]
MSESQRVASENNPADNLLENIPAPRGVFTNIIGYAVDNPLIILLVVAMLAVAGWFSLQNQTLDALPDLSENQVVIVADWMGRSPQVIDDQVAYPLSTLLSALPYVKDVRTMSSFGICMVYVIFEDQVDIYWARTRVSERLTLAREQLPEGVVPELGPEGTGVGHVYWYLVQNDEDPKTPAHDLAELRSLQDWYIRYQISTVQGVAEVASGGGFEREYHVDLDPNLMRRYMIMPELVVTAIRAGNNDVGGRIVEQSDMEYFVRSRGYLGGGENSAGATPSAVMADLRSLVVTHDESGTAIRLGQLGTVQQGVAQRRGVIDHNGKGEAVTGIIVMRYDHNAKQVIDRVKAKINDLKRGLPAGVVITTAHDRSWLIERSVETLQQALIQEMVVIALVILIFLLSIRPSLVTIITLPISVLLGFIGMQLMGISSNIMSLGGIAIAIGVVDDDSITLVENASRHLALLWQRAKAAGRKPTPYEITETIKRSAQQIGKPVFMTTVIIVVSFLPVFFLTGQEGKLFTPLAWTKGLVMFASALMAITLVPVLMRLLMRTRMLPEETNPISRVMNAVYFPALKLALELRWLTVILAVLALLATWPIYQSLGREFMPNLNEGELVYMPTTLPNVTVSEAKRLTQLTDAIMMQHPLVANVVGKAGRADTATDPAPVSMIESFVQFHPREQWGEIDPKYAGYTITAIRNDLDAMIKVPGLTNGWTMPIINRIQMLFTGVRTDIGVKIYGTDYTQLSALAEDARRIAETVPGIEDAFAERLTGGRYLDIDIDRGTAARYGLNIGTVQQTIEMLLGGMNVTTTVEGRERYGVQVRYASGYRDTPGAIGQLLIDTPHQGPIPLSTVASIKYTAGPSMVVAENGLMRSVVMANIRGRDQVSTIKDLETALDSGLKLPSGYYFRIAGQWENIVHAQQRLAIIMPIVLLLIFLILYFTFNNLSDTLIVYCSLPFAFVGGVWYAALLGLNISVAVWVGFIALFGLAVDTGVVMMVYLQEAMDRRLAKGWLRPGDVYSA